MFASILNERDLTASGRSLTEREVENDGVKDETLIPKESFLLRISTICIFCLNEILLVPN